MRKTVIEHVKQYSDITPTKPAVIAMDGTADYAHLFLYAEGYTRYLKHNGIEKNDIVVIKASQTLAYVVAYLGIHLANAVVLSMEMNTPKEALENVSKLVHAKKIIAEESFFDDSGRYINSGSILSDAQAYINSAFNSAFELQFPDCSDIADILFTTGTTGSSKGVILTHNALVATAENLIEGCGYQKDTVLILPGPLNHANAIRKVFTTLVNGSTLIILNGMGNIKAFYNALDYPAEKVACCLPPAAIRMIFALTRDRIGNYKDKIDFIESASAPLPETDKQRLCDLLPNTRLYNNYGSSESASVCLYDYNKNKGLKNCIGKATKNARIFIVDDQGNEIQSSKDQLGYIACAGDMNMIGYLNEPELTKEVLKNGVVLTSDVGYIDKAGYIYTVGRKSDVINVGGLKVAPAEVESAALGYDGINDCICIPIQNQITGSALKLLVVMEKGKPFDGKAIETFLKLKLEAFKVPTSYEEVEKVERTYNGKLNRKHYVQ